MTSFQEEITGKASSEELALAVFTILTMLGYPSMVSIKLEDNVVVFEGFVLSCFIVTVGGVKFPRLAIKQDRGAEASLDGNSFVSLFTDHGKMMLCDQEENANIQFQLFTSAIEIAEGTKELPEPNPYAYA